MKFLSFALCVAFSASGCTSREARQETPGAKSQVRNEDVSSPKSQVSSANFEVLQNQIKEIASEAKGKVGVAAIVLDDVQSSDGRRQEADAALVSLNPHEHF